MKPFAAGLLCMLVGATSAWAQAENPYLSQAKVFYQGLEYSKCIQRLDQATRWESTKKELAEIEIYYGMCKFNAGKKDEVKAEVNEHFRLALQLDPLIDIPPLTSPRLTEIWKGAVEKFGPTPAEREKLVAERGGPSTSAPAAATTVSEAPKPTKNRIPAYVAAGVAGAALATGIVFGIMANSASGDAKTSTDPTEKPSLVSRAYTNGQVADIAFIGSAVAAGAAVFLWVWPIGGESAPTTVAAGPAGILVHGTF
jgi:hypothetical protein